MTTTSKAAAVNASAVNESADPASIHLSPGEKQWLVKLATSHGRRLNLVLDSPPKRAMNSLVTKGMARCIGGTSWELTELGQRRCTSIY